VQDFRESIAALMKDKDFLQEADKTGMEINPDYGEDAEKLVVRLLRTPEAQAQKIRELLKF
jgi:hypothetical protein